MPVLVVSALRSKSEVGCYAAAELFLTASGILQQGVSSATFPALAASFVHDKATLAVHLGEDRLMRGVLAYDVAAAALVAGRTPRSEQADLRFAGATLQQAVHIDDLQRAF